MENVKATVEQLLARATEAAYLKAQGQTGRAGAELKEIRAERDRLPSWAEGLEQLNREIDRIGNAVR